MTAREFLKQEYHISSDEEFEKWQVGLESAEHFMVEFAKHHVELALKSTSESVKYFLPELFQSSADTENLLKIYPLENIK